MTHIHAILAHKDFEMPNKYYFDFNKVICFSQQPIVTNLENVVYKTECYDDRLVGEYAIWQYLLDNYKDVDWFSLHHYRRILNLYHEHFCVAKPIYFNCSLIQQTVSCHSVKLAQILEAILPKEDFEYLCRTNMLIPYNMMHIRRDVLTEWCKFIKFYIDKVFEILGTSDYDTLLEQMKKDETFTSNVLPNGQVNETKNCDPAYQVRIVAFLTERLNTLFWAKNMQLQPYYCEVDLLENNQKI